MIKYIVWPGYIISKNDGDRHYISAEQLVSLYGVSIRECIVINGPEERYKLRGINRDLINLFPRADGKYKPYKKEVPLAQRLCRAFLSEQKKV